MFLVCTACIGPNRAQLIASQREAEIARKAKEVADAQRITVRRLTELYPGTKADTPWIKRYRQITDLNILPALGDRPAATLTRADVQQVVDTVRERGASVQAKRRGQGCA
jgi:hypothetical protein